MAPYVYLTAADLKESLGDVIGRNPHHAAGKNWVVLNISVKQLLEFNRKMVNFNIFKMCFINNVYIYYEYS